MGGPAPHWPPGVIKWRDAAFKLAWIVFHTIRNTHFLKDGKGGCFSVLGPGSL